MADIITRTKKLFEYITSLDAYSAACRFLFGSQRLAVDTETCVREQWLTKKGSALDPHTGRISLIIIQKPKSLPYVFDLFHLEAAGYNPQMLIDVLESTVEYQLGVNYKFDMQFMKGTLNYMPERVKDVLIMGKLISNATGSKVGKGHGHSYADLNREYLNVHITGKKDLRTSSWGLGLSARTLDSEWWCGKILYAANDVKYLFQLHDIMEKVICDPLPNSPILGWNGDSGSYGLGMARVLKRESEFIPIIAEMEYGGMPVSLETMTLYQEGVTEALEDCGVYLSRELELDTPIRNWEGRFVPTNKALKMLRSSTGLLDILQKAINMKKINDVQGVTLKRMLDIIDLLHSFNKEDTGGDGESGVEDIFINSDEENLFGELTIMEESELLAISPVVKSILEFKKLTKQEGMDLRKFINPVTRNIHPKYDQLGAATSRCCIAAGMRVMIPGGEKNIEDIVPGDYVYCYDSDGKLAIKKVLNQWCVGERDIVEVKWLSYTKEEGRILCTSDHHFKTLDRGWVMASELRPREKIFHLQRRQNFYEGSNRPKLLGARGYNELEQLAIKKLYFRSPNEWHIHHVDFNSENNKLDNLRVMPAKEHLSLHGKHSAETGGLNHLKVYREDLKLNPGTKGPKGGKDSPNWIQLTRFQVLKMLAKAKGKPTRVPMDFATFKRKCLAYNIDIAKVAKRYGSSGVYLNKQAVEKALHTSINTEVACKKLGIGTRKLKLVCEELGVVYSNHSFVSIKSYGRGLVYDLEVEDLHNFICEELCVHNSSSRPNSQQISNKQHCMLTFSKPWFAPIRVDLKL